MRHLALLTVTCTLLACNRPERPHPQGPGLSADAAGVTVEQVPQVRKIEANSLLSVEQRKIVVAQIGDLAITLGDLEARLGQEPAVVRSQYLSLQKRKDFLQKLVQFEVLATEAKRQGLDKDPMVVEAMKQAMIRKYLMDVGQADVRGEDLKDAELKTYYDSNPGLYHKPEQVEVSHILVKTEALAKKIADELKAGAEGNAGKLIALWNDYVVRLSDDKGTAPYLGALGPMSQTLPVGASQAEVVRLNAVPRIVIDTAFAMKPFEVGPVVQSPLGWHVLMTTSRRPAVDRSYEAVKESIRVRVVKRQRDLQRTQLLESLRARAMVTVNDDALRLITIQAPEKTAKGMAQAPTPAGMEEQDLAP